MRRSYPVWFRLGRVGRKSCAKDFLGFHGFSEGREQPLPCGSGRFAGRANMRAPACKSNIEMTPLCKVEVTLARVLGSGEVHRGGSVVDEQAGVQPPCRTAAGSVGWSAYQSRQT